MRRPKTTARNADRPKIDVPTLGPIENLPIKLLRPCAKNARTHNERQIALIAQSIQTFGFLNPIIADEVGTVIAGHGRLEAAIALGLETVPVLRSRHLTPAKIRAYRIADNKLTELSGWDMDMLSLDFRDLEALDLDFSLEITGFEHAEIDLMA